MLIEVFQNVRNVPHKLFLKHKEQFLGGIRWSLILWLIVKGVTPVIHKQASCALKEKAAVKVQLLQE